MVFDVLRTPFLLLLFAFALGVLGTGVLLALHALTKGGAPHLWVSGLIGLGLIFLYGAFRQYLRRDSPRFWQPRRVTTTSGLAARIVGLVLLAIGVPLFARNDGPLRLLGGGVAGLGVLVYAYSLFLTKRND